MKVLCIVTNGFEEVEFVGTVGILRRGNVDIDIFSIHGNKAIGRYGIEVSNKIYLLPLPFDPCILKKTDYSKNSELEKIVKEIILTIKHKDNLKQLTNKCKTK